MIWLTHSWMPYDSEKPHVAWAVIDGVADVLDHAGFETRVWRDKSQHDVVTADDTLIVFVTGSKHDDAVVTAASRAKHLAAVFEDTNWDTSWHPGREYVAVTPYAALDRKTGHEMWRTMKVLGPRLDIDVPVAHVWLPTASIANATNWGRRILQAFEDDRNVEVKTDAVYVGSLKADRAYGFSLAVKHGTTFYGNFTRDNLQRMLLEEGYAVDNADLDKCVFAGRTESPYEVAAITSRFKQAIHMPDESFIRLDCDAVRYLELLRARCDEIIVLPPRPGDDYPARSLNELAYERLDRRLRDVDDWLMTREQLTQWATYALECINAQVRW